MKKLRLMFLLLFGLSFSFTQGQNIYRYISKSTDRISFAQFHIYEDSTFEYMVGSCFTSHTSGFWKMKGDSIVFNSENKEGDYVPEISEISDYLTVENGVRISFQTYYEDEDRQITGLNGIANIPFVLFTGDRHIISKTDSLGDYKNREVNHIDSIMVLDLYGYKNWKIIPPTSAINTLDVKFDIYKLMEKMEGIFREIYLVNEKWYMDEDQLMSPTGTILTKIE